MEKSNSLHVVMFPWLAMGHLIPFLNISKLLAQKGHRISFVSTPRNLQRLPRLPPKFTTLINFVSLPLTSVENLPENAESSMDIPYHKAQFLKIAFDLLKLPLADFLRTANPTPDWIVYDYASHWLPTVAADIGVPTVYFSLFSAATMAYIGPPSVLISREDNRLTAEEFTVVPKWIPFESHIVYRLHEVAKYVDGSSGNESGTSDPERFGAAIHGSDVVVLRSSVEFEPEWFNLLSAFYRKPIIPVGFLPPIPENVDELKTDEKWTRIEDWLDKQKLNSVIYVALGSESALSESELGELAHGLEKCGLPFLWVLRKQPRSTIDEIDMLPDGFMGRVQTRGLVHVGWVPQVNILSHLTIGGFLTHCGWNSVIEGLSFGRVLILLPIMNDQGLNARLLEGKKLAVEIVRDQHDGSFTSESVAESARLAMVSEEGESIRANTRKMRGLIGDKIKNAGGVDTFVCYLLENRHKR